MSKHTPGPWEVHPMTSMAVYQPQLECWIPQTNDDANLIAVSPELYALAERIARLNKDAGEIGAGMLASLVDEANRIIAKVEQ